MFALSEEQQLIQNSVKQFVNEFIKPNAAEWDRKKTFPKDTLKSLADMGIFGMTVPEKYSGSDIGYTACALVIEEIAAGDAATSTIISVTNSVACMPILNFGSEEQKEKFLVPLARGEYLGAFCLTEPHAGSDAADLKTKAIRDGDDYIINGSKQFITSGSHADIAIVFAVTDPNAGRKGISAFIVPTDTTGYNVASIENKLGQHASDTCQITFDNCRVPVGNRLGEEGQGYKIALSNLEGGRIGIAAQSVGIARAALESAIQYSKERTSFGKTLSQHQAIAFNLADVATDIEAARLLYLNAALKKENGKPCLKEASMAKLFASRIAETACSKAIHIHGGYGYLNDFPVERFYRDAKVCQIYEGTNEVQKLVISRSLLSD
ncbi:MAG: acyl-CoA dehydrogenase [Pseudomonadota bacterium]